MQQIRPEYAEFLHEQGLKPYSQYCRRVENDFFWVVQTLNDEAYDEIIVPLMSESFSDFFLESDSQTVKIEEKIIESTDFSVLIDRFYEESAPKYFKLDFVTPTAFKIDGRYVFFPDVYHIFASSMNKMNAISEENSMYSEESLDQLSNESEIVHYNLRSVRYSLEGVKIPAFMGTITIAVRGNQTMRNFAHLLLNFAEYSGIGIKTAMGMGAVKLVDQKGDKKHDD